VSSSCNIIDIQAFHDGIDKKQQDNGYSTSLIVSGHEFVLRPSVTLPFKVMHEGTQITYFAPST
jgi:hypothetical protein